VDENRLNQLMNHLDDDLMARELDELMSGVEIDMDAISQKAHGKLRKEQRKMNTGKRKILAVAAASLVVICGVTTAYASEISDFIKSLMNRTGVYGTVVEGQTYFLEDPVALDNGNKLTKAMFDKNELQIRVEMADGSFSGAKIRIDGVEIEPLGMEGHNLFFYDIEPVSQFELILGGKSFPVQLTSSQPVVGDGEIIEVESSKIPWVSLGYKKIEGGIQFLATTDDPAVKIVFFNKPGEDTVNQTTQNQGFSVSNSTRRDFLPLLGYDQDGNAYEFHSDPNDMGRPLTKFTTDAPAGKTLTMTLPGIVVATEKSINLDVDIPAEKEKKDVAQTIDLGLQKMRLDSIERTSDTTARLCFTLNTGGEEDVRIWETFLDSSTAESTESLWQDGTCVMDVTFPGGTNALQLHIANPTFIANGEWAFTIA
jgi:hypothetical protein